MKSRRSAELHWLEIGCPSVAPVAVVKATVVGSRGSERGTDAGISANESHGWLQLLNEMRAGVMSF